MTRQNFDASQVGNLFPPEPNAIDEIAAKQAGMSLEDVRKQELERRQGLEPKDKASDVRKDIGYTN